MTVHTHEQMGASPYRHCACDFRISTCPDDDFATLSISTGGARVQTYLDRDEIQRLEKALYAAWEELHEREESPAECIAAMEVAP